MAALGFPHRGQPGKRIGEGRFDGFPRVLRIDFQRAHVQDAGLAEVVGRSRLHRVPHHVAELGECVVEGLGKGGVDADGGVASFRGLPMDRDLDAAS